MNPTSIAAALTTTLLVACAPMQQTTTSPQQLKEEVTAFLNDYIAATSARDAPKIRNSYVADDRFVWIEEGKVRYRKADEVLAALSTLPAGSAIRTELKDLNVVPAGQSSAHAWATFRTSVGEGASGFSFGGVISITLERQGTSWKIVGGHTSSPGRR